jgi:hypothetical protein
MKVMESNMFVNKDAYLRCFTNIPTSCIQFFHCEFHAMLRAHDLK